MKIYDQVTGDEWQVTGTGRTENLVTRHTSRVTGFTMVEIAICLAIIGIALVAIIGVLPLGINVQKDNREETLVDQDATVFIENIRNGARGLDDLTNYVLAITNSWTLYKVDGTLGGSGVNGYSYPNFSVAPLYPTATVPSAGSPITNGMNIIGLLGTPEYIDANSGAPIPNLINGGISNHVVAYVRSLSGPAVDKPPQDNPIVLGDAFGYKIICNNAPAATYVPPRWTGGRYLAGAYVSYLLNGQITFWRATVGNLGDEPSQSSSWARVLYPEELTANLHELRLTFLWPLLPNGNTGNGRHTFATAVAGQIMQTTNNGQWLYFFQPQSFTSAP
jgi:prepilin-type N-terminal cleavage/methylation domain-containing protein